MSKIDRRAVLTGTAALAVTSGLLPGTATAAPRPSGAPSPLGGGDRAVARSVDARRALRHLRALSDQIGWRVSGTEAEQRAAHYIRDVLRGLGYQVDLQPFPVTDKRLAEMWGHGVHWQCGAAARGTSGTARGPILDLGTAVEVPDDVTGRIALFTRVGGQETAQARAASARGAVAVLIANVPSPSFPERKAGTFVPVLSEPVPVPVLGVAQFHGERIRAKVRRLSLVVRDHTDLTSYNVIGERPATVAGPDDEAIIVSAHYDSVPGSPGGDDDGSGTALCLELARVLRGLPTRRAVRIALWGSEESGLIGSRHYVRQLDDTAAGRIAGCFQNDMVATSEPSATVYWLLSVDGAPNATTTAVAAAAQRLGYAPRTRGPVARGSSDHESFHERGIAAGNFSWRGPDAPSRLEPVYHTPEDTVRGNISLARLQISMEIIGTAAYDLANRR